MSTTISINDKQYPNLMRPYVRAPKVLHCDGNTELLNTPAIAVIGTREPSPLGYKIAHTIAAYFASLGYTIVSGLARGCDTAAHAGALSVGGKTIAVLATPLWKIYPAENTDLARRIATSGSLLITEYTTNEYSPKRFFFRDHLQAALSLAVIPVQAGHQSGTLHTCKSAIEQGRLLAIPMPVERDAQKYPDKYAGIWEYWKMQHNNIFPIVGKADYPTLIERINELSRKLASN